VALIIDPSVSAPLLTRSVILRHDVLSDQTQPTTRKAPLVSHYPNPAPCGTPRGRNWVTAAIVEPAFFCILIRNNTVSRHSPSVSIRRAEQCSAVQRLEECTLKANNSNRLLFWVLHVCCTTTNPSINSNSSPSSSTFLRPGYNISNFNRTVDIPQAENDQC